MRLQSDPCTLKVLVANSMQLLRKCETMTVNQANLPQSGGFLPRWKPSRMEGTSVSLFGSARCSRVRNNTTGDYKCNNRCNKVRKKQIIGVTVAAAVAAATATGIGLY